MKAQEAYIGHLCTIPDTLRSYLLFTYLIPLAPFIVLLDGMVSMLRIYSPIRCID